MCIYLRQILICQVSCIEEISRFKQQLMKRRVENPLKIPLFFAIDFIKNVPKFDQKYNFHKHIKKNTKNLDLKPFRAPKTLPKPLRSREKIDEKSMLKTKAKK